MQDEPTPTELIKAVADSRASLRCRDLAKPPKPVA
ncbi:hypothetical protein ES703_107092 [subsurface metagenome]